MCLPTKYLVWEQTQKSAGCIYVKRKLRPSSEHENGRRFCNMINTVLCSYWPSRRVDTNTPAIKENQAEAKGQTNTKHLISAENVSEVIQYIALPQMMLLAGEIISWVLWSAFKNFWSQGGRSLNLDVNKLGVHVTMWASTGAPRHTVSSAALQWNLEHWPSSLQVGDANIKVMIVIASIAERTVANFCEMCNQPGQIAARLQ